MLTVYAVLVSESMTAACRADAADGSIYADVRTSVLDELKRMLFSRKLLCRVGQYRKFKSRVGDEAVATE